MKIILALLIVCAFLLCIMFASAHFYMWALQTRFEYADGKPTMYFVRPVTAFMAFALFMICVGIAAGFPLSVPLSNSQKNDTGNSP